MRLRLSPREAWRTTWREYAIVARQWSRDHAGASGPPPMSSDRLAELMAMYPDQPPAPQH